jgi:hypothetical protein
MLEPPPMPVIAILDRDAAPFITKRPIWREHTLPAIAAFAGTCAWMLAAPFEQLDPVLRLPWQTVSNLEAISLGILAAWFVTVAFVGARPRWQTAVTWPWLVWVGAMSISAAASPVFRVNAVHMTGRMAFAFVVFLVTINGVSTVARLRLVMVAAICAGTLVALLTILEYFRVGPVLRWLLLFRPGLSVLGDQVRAGGPLQYATIASMYLEIVFALGLGVLMHAVDDGRHALAVVIGASLLAMAEAISFTFTRAGLVTVATSLLLVAMLRYRDNGVDRGVRIVAVLAALIAGLFAASRSTQALWLRFTSGGQEAWYKAVVEAPPDVTIPAGTTAVVPITVTNAGRARWDSEADPPIRFSYHWLQADADRVITFDGARTRFRLPVPPVGTASLGAHVDAPRRPGRYRIAWDVVQEGRLWFSTEPGGTMTISRATVSGTAPPGLTPQKTTPLPQPVERPGRIALWRAAARMFATRPLLGVGPDNYRLLYGPFAQVANPDSRMHSNNMYIEMWVGCGVAGGLAFLWLVWRAAGRFAAVARDRAAGPGLGLGVAAAGLAILLHGLLDSFLSFTPTSILIAMTIGLAVASAGRAETGIDAHRV